jgi:tyrosinase
MQESAFFRFQTRLESSPHGTVHGAVGGLMARVPTSANDPVFWLHHANVDRLWDHWLQASSSHHNPADDAYLNHQFRFADSDGTTVTVSVRDIISSAQLGYRYDDVSPTPEPALTMELPQESFVLASTALAPTATADNPLGFSDKRVNLEFADEGIERMQAVTEATAGGLDQRVFIRINGLGFSELPAFTYGVYLDPPEGEDSPERLMSHYVGSINFFGADHVPHGDIEHAEPEAAAQDLRHSFDFELEVTDRIATLVASGNWDPEALSVVLKPLAPVPPKDMEVEKISLYMESAERARLSYDTIELVTHR